MTRRLLGRLTPAILGAALALAAPSAGAQTFDFEPPAAGPTPLTLTSGGVEATFGNPGQPFFEILSYAPGTFTGLSGQVLGDATADIAISPLGIDFNVLLSGFSLNFALTGLTAAGGTPTQFDFEAYNGLTLIGSGGVGAGAGPTFPEGTLAVQFFGLTFDRLVLSSDAVDFAIDNLEVTPAATVPEPATVGLLGLGLVTLAGGAAARRRKGAA